MKNIVLRLLSLARTHLKFYVICTKKRKIYYLRLTMFEIEFSVLSSFIRAFDLGVFRVEDSTKQLCAFRFEISDAFSKLPEHNINANALKFLNKSANGRAHSYVINFFYFSLKRKNG